MKSFPLYDKIVHIEANNLNGKEKSNCRVMKRRLATPMGFSGYMGKEYRLLLAYQ